MLVRQPTKIAVARVELAFRSDEERVVPIHQGATKDLDGRVLHLETATKPQSFQEREGELWVKTGWQPRGQKANDHRSRTKLYAG